MIKSILLWAVKVPTLLLLTVIAWFISPILALFIRLAEEYRHIRLAPLATDLPAALFYAHELLDFFR